MRPLEGGSIDPLTGVAFQISCISDFTLLFVTVEKLQLWNGNENNVVGIRTAWRAVLKGQGIGRFRTTALGEGETLHPIGKPR